MSREAKLLREAWDDFRECMKQWESDYEQIGPQEYMEQASSGRSDLYLSWHRLEKVLPSPFLALPCAEPDEVVRLRAELAEAKKVDEAQDECAKALSLRVEKAEAERDQAKKDIDSEKDRADSNFKSYERVRGLHTQARRDLEAARAKIADMQANCDGFTKQYYADVNKLMAERDAALALLSDPVREAEGESIK